ncbi:S-adenosyl-L-methionine-dependent methyltransferase [Mytilinidion resinicola]|uniref:S-adenosyl-L-methionine-dependent methyltransferase n=1 Tax=Mytilinidion resinicola TaxID=574789 RepID=A0A6A6ZAI8_9PEZI|nr:S-adenosyl-L-methionine-dependent methyltransferase [Mytilinidion resinicola]KAF2817305.1 S-adenosyl-L-methionine-dependent methyltransferase [Mytilinidion resinicola]
MSNPTPDSISISAEKTFTSYTKDQGATYAQTRLNYHPSLYTAIIDHHASTGGQFNSLLDVGCGPGTAIRALAPHFAHAIGLDPSDGMINYAIELPGATSTSEPIRFEVSTAEDLGWHLSPPVEDASVDLITASTAAHWFDMARFWPSATRVLKPGGTVAIWTGGSICIHPTMPNAAAIQATLDEIEERDLKPFFLPGNLLTRGLYIDLPLPWTLETPVPAFDETTFFRREWAPEKDEEFFAGGGQPVSLDMMERVMGTISPIHRWRDAHPDAVGTERDILRIMRRDIERLLHEAGVEKGKEVVQASLNGVLLMIKKKA